MYISQANLSEISQLLKVHASEKLRILQNKPLIVRVKTLENDWIGLPEIY